MISSPHPSLPFVLSILALAACGGGESSSGVADAAVDAGSRPDAGSQADATGVGPEITVEPTSITLVADLDAVSEPAEFAIRNDGDAPLVVDDIDFDPAPPASAGFALIGRPDSLPTEIAPGEIRMVSLTYAPSDAGPHHADIRVRSNDADESDRIVSVSGRVRQSCLRINPTEVELGRAPQGGQSGRGRVQLVNCGDFDVRISGVSLEGNAGFAWDAGGEDPAGRTIAPSQSLSFEVWYVNEGLAVDEAAAATLVIGTDDPEHERIEIALHVRGGGGPTCRVTLTPSSIDFDVLRLGLDRTIEIQIANDGSDVCELLGIAVVTDDDNPPENTFELTASIDAEVLEPGASHTIAIAYAPNVANPLGDRGTLRVEYHDPHIDQNRTETAPIVGIGDEAVIGAVPEAVAFGEITAATCASHDLTARAENVGFVPICIFGYRVEGDACDRFVLLDPPQLGDCFEVNRGEAAVFEYRYQPEEVGEDMCTLIVTSDAMNTTELDIFLRGEAVESDATADDFVMGRVNAQSRARFHLRRSAVEASIAVAVNGASNDRWAFDDRRNDIYFAAGRHPAIGSDITVEYDATCFERR